MYVLQVFCWSIVALNCSVFLRYSRVNQLYVYICPLFFGFPSQSGDHRALSRVPCVLYSRFSAAYFKHSISNVNMSIPVSQFTPPCFTPLLYICLFSTSVSPFLLRKWVHLYLFLIPHIGANFFWLTSLYMTVSRSIHVSANGVISFLFTAE